MEAMVSFAVQIPFGVSYSDIIADAMISLAFRRWAEFEAGRISVVLMEEILNQSYKTVDEMGSYSIVLMAEFQNTQYKEVAAATGGRRGALEQAESATLCNVGGLAVSRAEATCVVEKVVMQSGVLAVQFGGCNLGATVQREALAHVVIQNDCRHVVDMPLEGNICIKSISNFLVLLMK